MISATKIVVLLLGLAAGGCVQPGAGQLIGYEPSGLNYYQTDELVAPRPGNDYDELQGLSLYPAPDGGPTDELIEKLAAGLVAAHRRRNSGERMPEDLAAMLGRAGGEERELPAGYYHYDVNSHLPASPSGGNADDDSPGDLSPPANDPEEFEARLGQLTDALNHRVANTRDRHELLLELLNRSSELRPPVNSLSNINQLEMSRMVGELEALFEQRNRAAAEARAERGVHQEDAGNGYTLASLSRYGGSEYIDHPPALAGHQYVQGGAGEGRQLLGPEGTFENTQVVKSDSAIPSYCDPPNPCPVGYTAKDGCLEDFVNSASFSREYQAQQQCSCDNEHSLFNCAAPVSPAPAADGGAKPAPGEPDKADSPAGSAAELDGKLDTLARTIQNRFGDLASVRKLVDRQKQKQQQQQQPRQLKRAHQGPAPNGNDDADPNYLVRSARKLSSLDMHHKVDLD